MRKIDEYFSDKVGGYTFFITISFDLRELFEVNELEIERFRYFDDKKEMPNQVQRTTS